MSAAVPPPDALGETIVPTPSTAGGCTTLVSAPVLPLLPPLPGLAPLSLINTLVIGFRAHLCNFG